MLHRAAASASMPIQNGSDNALAVANPRTRTASLSSALALFYCQCIGHTDSHSQYTDACSYINKRIQFNSTERALRDKTTSSPNTILLRARALVAQNHVWIRLVEFPPKKTIHFVVCCERAQHLPPGQAISHTTFGVVCLFSFLCFSLIRVVTV